MAFFSYSRKVRTDLLVGLVVGLLAVIAVRLRPVAGEDPPASTAMPASPGLVERAELAIYDALAAHLAQRAPANPEILLAGVDDEALAEVRPRAGGWPWPREVLGEALVELHALGARLVVDDGLFVDPDLHGDDARFAELVGESGAVVLGFNFATASDESPPALGRWAVLRGSYATRGAALAAAGPLLARGAHPYLVVAGERVEVWLGGYKDRAEALERVEKLSVAALGENGEPAVRELAAAESLERVTREGLFAERNAVRASGPQVFALRGTPRVLQPPVAPLVASPARFGDVDLLADADGAVRSIRHLVKSEGRYYPSLALAAALTLSGANAVVLEHGRLTVGAYSVPVDGGGRTLLRLYGAPGGEDPREASYPSMSLAPVLRSAQRRKAGRSVDRRLEEQVRGRIVFLVPPAPARRATALARAAMPTPVLQAMALDGLLRSDGLVRASVDHDSLVVLALALFGSLVSLAFTRTAHPRRTLLLQTLASAAVLAAFTFAAVHGYRGGVWVAFAVPVAAFLGALALATAVSWADEHGTHLLILDVLGRHTSPSLVDRILRSPREFALEGDRRPMSVYFVDIVDFALVAQQLAPRALVRLLRGYVSEVSERVLDCEGHVDKFIGDGVMAWWGAPLRDPEHALRACRAALQVRDALTRRRADWRERFGVELRAGAGLDSGEVVVGNMGSRGARGRTNYSVVGEPVGHAERLEQATRAWGVDLIIGEGCFELVREQVEVRELDLVRVRGRTRPTRIFELLALRGELSEAARGQAARFEQALVAYRRRDFRGALGILESLAAELPADRPVAIYLERCRACIAAPPPEAWDGVFDPAAGARRVSRSA